MNVHRMEAHRKGLEEESWLSGFGSDRNRPGFNHSSGDRNARAVLWGSTGPTVPEGPCWSLLVLAAHSRPSIHTHEEAALLGPEPLCLQTSQPVNWNLQFQASGVRL